LPCEARILLEKENTISLWLKDSPVEKGLWSLKFESLGCPDIVKIIAYDSARTPIAVFVPRGGCPDDSDYIFDELPAAAPASNKFGPEEYLAALDKKLDSGDVPNTRYCRYFSELHKHSHRSLIPVLEKRQFISPESATQRIAAVSWARDTMVERMQSRASGCDLPNPVSSLRTRVQHLSLLQLTLIQQYFGHPSGINLTDLARAYEQFANGQLRFRLEDLVWTCQPSSAYFFCFGEFALMSMDYADPLSSMWERVAPVLVRSQLIFQRVYGPDDPTTATFNSYSACRYKGSLPQRELDKIRADNHYKNMDEVRAGATSNARCSFRGGF
jgi:hypothetical protein